LLFQKHFMTAELRWLDWCMAAVYYSYFVVPHIVGLVLLRRSKTAFWRYGGPFMGVLFLASAIAAILPTLPPWLASEEAALAPVERRIGTLWDGVSEGAQHRQDEVASANEVAAMPSLHFAVPVLLALLAHRRWLAVAGWAYAATMGVALVYLGEHY